jgi:Fe-S-cluster containining protein
MIDTVYLHMEFKRENGNWSINLPFLCTKCGVCCTLDDFLMAGEIKAKPETHPEVHAKMESLKKELGKLFDEGEEIYERHVTHTRCPFQVDNTCSIYEIRPDGCRQFPNTPFGMLSQDCEALNRFKKQRSALKKGRTNKETYHFTLTEPIKPAKCTGKQYQNCIAKLCQAGITADELALFESLNKQLNE